MSNLGNYFGSLGTTLTKIGQVAGEVGSYVDGTVQNVAGNLEQTLRENLRVSPNSQNPGSGVSPNPDITTTARSPSGGRFSSRGGSTSSSTATTPDSDQYQFSGTFSSANPRGASGGGNNTNNSTSSSDQANKMVCDNCEAKFPFFSRKKLCNECKNYFCNACITRQSSTSLRTCVRCRVLLSKPPIRADLMDLRVKDLRSYLVSKRVNTKACVEKKDLVELVMRENGGGIPPTSSNSASATPSSFSSAHVSRDPVERHNSGFPKSYTESTHRSDWLEKFERGRSQNDEDTPPTTTTSSSESTADLVEGFVVVPSPSASDTPTSTSTPTEEASEAVEDTPVEPMHEVTEEAEPGDVLSASQELRQQSGEGGGGAVGGAGGVSSTSTSIPAAASSLRPNVVENVASSCSPGSSPRRFANQGLVYLSEIENLDDLHELSVKQMKDVLAMNRVTYKGVVEKEELLKIVKRLWEQEQKSQTEKDAMEDDDLCKICMDNPVDCVMLECGHMCTCTKCGKQMAECPICRQYVVRVVRTFKA